MMLSHPNSAMCEHRRMELSFFREVEAKAGENSFSVRKQGVISKCQIVFSTYTFLWQRKCFSVADNLLAETERTVI